MSPFSKPQITNLVTPYHIALGLLVTETLAATPPPSPDLIALVLRHLSGVNGVQLAALLHDVGQYSSTIATSVHTTIQSLCTTLGDLQSYLRAADGMLAHTPTVTLDDLHAVCGPPPSISCRVSRATPAGLLFRRLRLAGDTLSFEALSGLHQDLIRFVNGTTPVKQTPPSTTTTFLRDDCTAAVDHSHAHFDHSISTANTLPAALLSLASILDGRDMLAVDEAVRVAQQHADDDTLAHAMVFNWGEDDDYTNRYTACRRRAAARLLPHLVAHCDLARASVQNWHTIHAACITTQRLAHAVAIAPETYCSPRLLSVHAALCDALARMAYTHALLYTGAAAATAGCYTLAQAAAAGVLADGCDDEDRAVAYAQLASNALEVDVHMAQRVLDLVGGHSSEQLARVSARCEIRLGEHGTSPYRALAQKQYNTAFEYALTTASPETLVLLGRIVLAAGDATGALPYVLSAMVQADALVAAHASIVLADALVQATPPHHHHHRYVTQLVHAALPLLATARHTLWLAKAHSILALVTPTSAPRHLKLAAGYYEQQGAWDDAAHTWHLAALLCREQQVVTACAHAVERVWEGY